MSNSMVLDLYNDTLEVREEIIEAAKILLGMKNSIYGQEQIDAALSHLAIAVQIIGEPVKEDNHDFNSNN